MSVVWLNGTVGAGKSTLARSLRALVHPVAAVALLDEDEVRRAAADADPSAAERDGDSRFAGLGGIARVLAYQGLVVVVAASDCPDSDLAWNRANLPGYREVLLEVSPETIRHRARHRRPIDAVGTTGVPAAGQATARPAIAGLAGEAPPLPDPDLTIDMDNPEPPELLAFRVAVLIPEFVVAAAGAAGLDARRFRRGA